MLVNFILLIFRSLIITFAWRLKVALMIARLIFGFDLSALMYIRTAIAIRDRALLERRLTMTGGQMVSAGHGISGGLNPGGYR
jgi:predicted MFS family arabinose efflux permease